jgi:hypothetical protein
MENKVKLKLIPIIFIALFLLVGFFSIQFTIKIITSDIKINQKNETVEVNKNVYDSIIPQNGLPAIVSKDSSGFGRENPFNPYK